ncbi:cardiolipin synthase [Halobacillus seohaensis]|uniref:Cardiolipin synthase n=1 Tax=Halobacillus seohaensis TaxID=447421 RepID=A0ABW2ELF0_9BACI
MTALLIIVVILIIIIALAILDFSLGKRQHEKKQRSLLFPQTTGDYQLYSRGQDLFEDFFQDIDNAKKQVDILFYIVKNDRSGQKFMDIIKKKAREGIQVRLLVDRLGGLPLSKKIRNDLKDAGVQFQFSETPNFPFFFYKLNRRNHRKITVIDGKIGYIGGFNIGQDYVGENAYFQDWRDYHLRYIGPVVSDLHKVFLNDWHLATNQHHDPIINKEKHPYKIKVIATDGNKIEEDYIKIIEQAKSEILIGSAYFIPTNEIMDSLKNALKRGVAVHVLLPLKSDHPLVKEAAIPYLEEVYKHGGHINLYDAGFYHAKVMVIDQKFADLGTANFDRRSMFLNKEINTYIYNQAFIDDLRSAYLKDSKDAIIFNSEWLASRSLKIRINQQIAKLVRPLL